MSRLGGDDRLAVASTAAGRAAIARLARASPRFQVPAK